MKLIVPFIYEALLIKKRCRKTTVVSVLDTVSVEIREKKASDMPVALRLGNQEFRWDGEQLWDFSYHRVANRPVEKVTAEAILNNTCNGAYNRYSCATAEAPFAHFWRFEKDSMAQRHGVNMCCLLDRLDEADFPCAEAIEYRKWVDDNRQTMINRARAIAASRVIIDGAVLTPVGEPMYVVNRFGLGNNHGGTGMFVTQSYNSNIGHENYFNALNFEKACQYADAVAIQRGDDRSVPVRPNGGHVIEVLIPEAVKANPKREHGEGCEFINSIEASITAGGPIGGIATAFSKLAC